MGGPHIYVTPVYIMLLNAHLIEVGRCRHRALNSHSFGVSLTHFGPISRQTQPNILLKSHSFFNTDFYLIYIAFMVTSHSPVRG